MMRTELAPGILTAAIHHRQHLGQRRRERICRGEAPVHIGRQRAIEDLAELLRRRRTQPRALVVQSIWAQRGDVALEDARRELAAVSR